MSTAKNPSQSQIMKKRLSLGALTATASSNHNNTNITATSSASEKQRYLSNSSSHRNDKMMRHHSARWLTERLKPPCDRRGSHGSSSMDDTPPMNSLIAYSSSSANKSKQAASGHHCTTHNSNIHNAQYSSHFRGEKKYNNTASHHHHITSSNAHSPFIMKRNDSIYAFDYKSCCRNYTSKRNDQSWFQYLFCKCCNCCDGGNTGNPHSDNGDVGHPANNEYDNTTYTFLVTTFTHLGKTFIWFLVKGFSTVVLLFFSGIQYAWCPKSVDAVFDGIYAFSFIVLMIDIFMLCFIDPLYLPLQIGSWKNVSTQKLEEVQQQPKSDSIPVHIGSFMFWCDLLSTCTLFYDMSFVFTGRNEEKKTWIRTYNGMVVDASVSFENERIVQHPLTVLVALARSARITRCLSPSNVTKLSSRINWFWLPRSIYGACHTRNRAGDSGDMTSSFHSKSQYRCLPCHGCLFSCCGKARSREEILFTRQNDAARTIQKAWRFFHVSSSDFGSEKQLLDPRKISATPQDQNVNTKKFLRVVSSLRRSSNNSIQTSSSFSSNKTKNIGHETQVGTAMRDLTGQRIVFGILISVVATVLFTYMEADYTRPLTMRFIHSLAGNNLTHDSTLLYAALNKTDDLMSYSFFNTSIKIEDAVQRNYSTPIENYTNPIYSQDAFRAGEVMNIIICSVENKTTTECVGVSEGSFDDRANTKAIAGISLLFTVFVIILWFFAVTSFVGPLMILVVIPIERIISLLRMMMKDPLGYQTSRRYKAFISEENDIMKNTPWTKDVLKGMETSFLMSTISRIGSLMKVGFGTAGVEVIRNSLEKGGYNKEVIFKNLQGCSVSCIFMFCDVRGFTDATECLQEEIFVFTNRIAAVVHSYCHAYGGAANQNAGDAFLMTWKLDTPELASTKQYSSGSGIFRRFSTNAPIGRQNLLRSSSSNISSNMFATQLQADKALLACVKICIALQHDDFFLDSLSESASIKLKEKTLSKRPGPIVQIGIGLHAGKAVQGAIGSQRKLDPTYIGTNVNFAEFLESQSKEYGVKIVMSHLFVQLLKPSLRMKCRKIDRVCADVEIEEISTDLPDASDQDVIDIYTFDFDVLPAAVGSTLQLPGGPLVYSESIWKRNEMRQMFKRFLSDGNFFQQYTDGLNHFYNSDWENAQKCFEYLRDRYEDGPSKYFLDIIITQGAPPRNFTPYRVVS